MIDRVRTIVLAMFLALGLPACDKSGGEEGGETSESTAGAEGSGSESPGQTEAPVPAVAAPPAAPTEAGSPPAMTAEEQAQMVAELQQVLAGMQVDMSARPTCQRLMDCCSVFARVAEMEGTPELAASAVSTCEMTAQVGTDEVCSQAIAGVRRDLAPSGVTFPESCTP